MNIEFINENTVKITASMHWTGYRPPQSEKRFLKTSDVVKAFNKEHPAYEIKNVSGPSEICNFRDESNSRGQWLLEVQKPQREVSKPKPTVEKPHAKKSYTKKTTKKGA